MNPLVWFRNAASKCRNKYGIVLNLRVRTDDALYEALRWVYALYLQMRGNGRYRDAFYHDLKSNKMRKGGSEPLTLVELVFFPHVLLRREKGNHQNHKADLNKASSYAKVISYAVAHKVKSADFVKFIRDNGGIQVIAKAETGRCPRRKEQIGIRLGKSRPAAAGGPVIPVVKPPRPGHCPLPLALWCTDEIAVKIIEATNDAYSGDSNRFIIHGQWYDTNNAIVSDIEIPPKLRPLAKSAVLAAKRQPTGKRGLGKR